MVTQVVAVSPSQRATSKIRYQTIEQKRAALHIALLRQPHDEHLRSLLAKMTPPSQIRRASRDGVFINYARRDELFALQLALDLCDAGVKVWMDELNIPMGADWDADVRAALDGCGVMLTVMSNYALRRRDLHRERLHFVRQGKIVLPVMYRCGTRDLPGFLPPVAFHADYRHGLRTLTDLFGAEDDVAAPYHPFAPFTNGAGVSRAVSHTAH